MLGKNRAKSHLYLAKRLPFIKLQAHSISFIHFSPYASSPEWVVSGLLGLELLKEPLSTHLGFFPY